MPADWAAQRVKNLDLGKAVLNALMPKRNQKEIASLIEEFQYPKYGPGMMWERCRDLVEGAGGTVLMETAVTTIHVEDGRATAVTLTGTDGNSSSSRLPRDLLDAHERPRRHVRPPAPDEVLEAGRDLHYRDF